MINIRSVLSYLYSGIRQYEKISENEQKQIEQIYDTTKYMHAKSCETN